MRCVASGTWIYLSSYGVSCFNPPFSPLIFRFLNSSTNWSTSLLIPTKFHPDSCTRERRFDISLIRYRSGACESLAGMIHHRNSDMALRPFFNRIRIHVVSLLDLFLRFFSCFLRVRNRTTDTADANTFLVNLSFQSDTYTPRPVNR